MTTVLQIVNGAAEHVNVRTAETDLEAFEFQQILDNMNDLLSEWADSGLTPAFTEVSNSTDTVNIDRNAVAAVKYALAIRIAPAFTKVVTQALAKNAADSFQKLQASVVYIGRVAYPDTLPTGSGNDCFDGFDDDRFFPANSEVNF
tara:strand:- start:43 stop:480 length:438 start_codon:yes stop_codon:yes gene_type:complete